MPFKTELYLKSAFQDETSLEPRQTWALSLKLFDKRTENCSVIYCWLWLAWAVIELSRAMAAVTSF